MTWGEKKLQAISICLLDLPFLTSAMLRTHFLFSLVYGSLSLSPCEWGKGLGGHSRPPRRSSLLCEMGRSFPDWSDSDLPITLPFIHPLLGRAGPQL